MSHINLNLPEISDEDMLREMDHEQEMLEVGMAHFNNRLSKEKARGNGAHTVGGKALMASLTTPLADTIIEEIARLESGRVKRKPPELRTLKLLPARDTALLTLSATLDTMAVFKGEECTLQKLGFRVGNAIATEVMAREFHQTQRPLFNAVVRKVQARGGSVSQRQKELVRVFEGLDGAECPMENTEKVRLGAFLVTCAETLGLVESHSVHRGRRQLKFFGLTEKVLQVITDTEGAMAQMQPHMVPTLIAPRPWTSLRSGGYWLPFRGTSMVVARNPANGIRDASDEEMPRMFTPVNYLQNTPFQINKFVHEVILQMRKVNMTCASLPPSELDVIPPKPHDIEHNEEARAAWRLAARSVYTRNSAAKGRILAAEKTVAVATSMRDEPAIFFPKVIDFRGRVYDLPMFLKPQGDDLSKGLLTFATGKKLGATGGYWLAVHGANVWGEDKVSLDDRVQWVQTNQSRIIAAGAEPFTERFWLEADKPFQFLAFCKEWAMAVAEGDDFVSHLPVALDGSCNGLQHLSAILSDEVGGKAVNLLPAELPQDIYTEVLDRVVDTLRVKAASGEPTAQKWLPLMARKVVKRPVMTLPYGATKQGFADQIMEDTVRPLEKAHESPFTESYAAAQYLAGLVWDATGEVVVAARVAMGWLQDVAKVASKAQKEIVWTTPTGFKVKQNYRDLKTRGVELMASGQRVQLQIAEGHTDKINKRKMSMAIAPNFVHAMDAAHMLRTVELLTSDEGVGPSIHLSMVHDSYATHAADAEVLSSCIREAFVEMYEETCWLTEFRNEVAEQIGEELAAELPEVPARGTLDLQEVLNSMYFFA